MSTKYAPPSPEQIVALSCAVVGIGAGGCTSMLARVSIVDYRGQELYDHYVLPTNTVTDYRTATTGITAGNLHPDSMFPSGHHPLAVQRKNLTSPPSSRRWRARVQHRADAGRQPAPGQGRRRPQPLARPVWCVSPGPMYAQRTLTRRPRQCSASRTRPCTRATSGCTSRSATRCRRRSSSGSPRSPGASCGGASRTRASCVRCVSRHLLRARPCR